MNTITIISLVLIGGFFLGIIVLSLYKKRLLHIEILVPQQAHSSGDSISGRVIVKSKRNLKIDTANISLRCTDSKDSNNPHPIIEIYKDTKTLAIPLELHTGETHNEIFKFKVPNTFTSPGISMSAPEWHDKALKPLRPIAIRRRKMDIDWEVCVDITSGVMDFDKRFRLDIDLIPS